MLRNRGSIMLMEAGALFARPRLFFAIPDLHSFEL
jgi:hypothetical protein